MALVGVILAAGAGVRIHPLSVDLPKPLLPICNKPIMQYQLELMQAAGIRDVFIVVGGLGHKIRERFGGGSSLGLSITYVDDRDPQGIAHSLLVAEPHIGNRPFALFLGDIYIHRLELASLIVESDGRSLLLVKPESNIAAIQRNFAVVVAGDARVLQVVEKPDQPPSHLKGVGVYILQPAIFDAIRRTGRSSLRGEYELTDSIQTLIDSGNPTYAADIPSWDANITYPSDLLECNLRILRERGLSYLLGENVCVSPGTQLSEAVLGDGTTVLDPMTIQSSVVLAGAQLTGAGRSISNAIVTSQGELVLRPSSPGAFV